MPVTISSRAAQKAYDHFQAMHDAANALPAGPTTDAMQAALTAAHDFATKHFMASGGVFIPAGDTTTATTAAESSATVVNLSVGAGSKN